MDIVIFVLAKLHIERKAVSTFTRPEAQFLPNDLLGTRLEKIEWSFIGIQMVEYKEKIPIKKRQLS